MAPRSMMIAIAFAGLVACHPAPSEPPEPATPTVASAPLEHSAMVVGRVTRDGESLPGVSIAGGGRVTPVVSDAAGRFELKVADEFAKAPAIHLRLSSDRHGFAAVLPNSRDPIEVVFELGDGLRVELPNASPEDRAWVDVHAWATREYDEWMQTPKDDPNAHRAQWARIAEQVAEQTDDHRRGLMLAAQFKIGRSDPEFGLTRVDAAEQALDELGFEDPRWSINPYMLATAVSETGRWDELSPRLDALISSYPQPEVAAYLALARYMQTAAEGPADEAAAIWQRWLDRPALARTPINRVMQAHGPNRGLAPGQRLPELCVEQLGGGSLCTADLKGELIVLELWSTWCGGCRTVAATLRAAREALGEDAPMFVSINPYDDPATIEAFLADEPMPWRHGWVVEAERDAVIESFQLQSIPMILLIGADGVILASSPQLQAEQLVDRVRALRGSC